MQEYRECNIKIYTNALLQKEDQQIVYIYIKDSEYQ